MSDPVNQVLSHSLPPGPRWRLFRRPDDVRFPTKLVCQWNPLTYLVFQWNKRAFGFSVRRYYGNRSDWYDRLWEIILPFIVIEINCYGLLVRPNDWPKKWEP